jgi:formylmethanofuran dehydrogenase subunit E
MVSIQEVPMTPKRKRAVTLTAPCTKCNKLISNGYGSYLSGVYVCKECLAGMPHLISRLDAPTLKAFKAGTLK